MLLVDAGNTRIKWALLEGGAGRPLGAWSASGSVSSDATAQLADAWRHFKVSRVVVSNVAGEVVREALQLAVSQAFGSRPVALEWFQSVAERGGIRNGYRNPAQLGCDRFAAMIGARALFPDQALIVATCGTATTVDAVTADGRFVGGMIFPGVGLMASSLARNTAQLPMVVHPGELTTPFADHTDAAIAGGCLAAQAGAIERALAAHPQRPGPVGCVISGGAAAVVASHLSIPCHKVDNLVLTGLQAATQT